MKDRSIRPRTAAERDAQQQRNQARYDRLFAEVEAEHHAAWVDEFGADHPGFPFRANGAKIHAEVVARIALEDQ